MHRSLIGWTVAVAITLTSPATTLAQDPGTGEAVRRPNHVHVGLCPTPGDVVAPLSDVTPPVGELMGSGAVIPVESGHTTIALALSEMLASEHAVVVHMAHDDMATLLACGDVTGPVVAGTSLVIGLGPVGDSGYSGIAMLTGEGDGSTTVDVFITSSGSPSEAPSASS